MAKNKKNDTISSSLKEKQEGNFNQKEKKMDTRVVKQANLLIEAHYLKKLTTQEFKFSRFIVTEVRRKYLSWTKGDDPTNINLNFSAKEYAEAMHTSIENIYKDGDEITSNLGAKHFKIKKEGEWEKYWWFARAKYKEGVFDILVNADIVQFILDLSKGFTNYQLKNILKLKSTYALQLYELLKQYEFKGIRKLEISELKEFFGISEIKSYKRYCDFKKRVIISAIKEINLYSDTTIKFKEIKTGRKITAIEFTILDKEKNKYLNKYREQPKEIKKEEPVIMKSLLPRNWNRKSLLQKQIEAGT